MIPIRDVIPSRTRPVVTVGLIALNIAVFIWELTMPLDARQAFVTEYGLKSYAFWWPTVFTSMFLHVGLLHIASNLICLWVFGDNVEDQMGHGRFLVFYLLTGSTAALAQLVLGGSMLPMVGASGAIAGVMGAYLVMFPRSEVHVFVIINVVEMPAAVFLPIWFLMQLLAVVDKMNMSGYGATDVSVAFWAHIGGFVMGAIAVLVFRRPERAEVDWWDQAGRG